MNSWVWISNTWCKWNMRIVTVVTVISTIFIIFQLTASNQGDIAWYQWIIHDWFNGNLPYLGHIVEYPPYALLIFIFPWLLGDGSYLINFMVLALCIDIAIKVILFIIGKEDFKDSNNSKAFLPLFFYSVVVLFISYFYLQRFDLWPVIISLLALWSFYKKRFLLSGVLISVGIGVKLYPILFVLPLLILAFRYKRYKRFISGLLIGILPIIILSFFLPWWNFLQFHGVRGLQVESLYASIIWLAHLLGMTDAIWIRTTAWFEVQGLLSSVVMPWAKILFVCSVLASTISVIWYSLRISLSRISIATLARIMLIPLLAFVSFNLVISPQYMIWIIPLAVLIIMRERVGPSLLIFIAVALTSLFYPTHNYFSQGLNLFETIILLLRNIMLVISWIWFMIGTIIEIRQEYVRR